MGSSRLVSYASEKFRLIFEQIIKKKEKLPLINIVRLTKKSATKQQKNQIKKIQRHSGIG